MSAEANGRIVYLSELPQDKPPQLFADVADVVSVPQAGELLGVTAKTIYREIARGKLQCVRIGSRVRITKVQLLDYLEGAMA